MNWTGVVVPVVVGSFPSSLQKISVGGKHEVYCLRRGRIALFRGDEQL